MKLIIDLDDDIAKGIRGENDCKVEPSEIVRSFQATIAEAIANGTPYNKTDRWIPVTERLPEKDKNVLVTDNEVDEVYMTFYIGDGLWCCDDGVYEHRITHWRHLPKPYESEDK